MAIKVFCCHFQIFNFYTSRYQLELLTLFKFFFQGCCIFICQIFLDLEMFVNFIWQGCLLFQIFVQPRLQTVLISFDFLFVVNRVFVKLKWNWIESWVQFSCFKGFRKLFKFNKTTIPFTLVAFEIGYLSFHM